MGEEEKKPEQPKPAAEEKKTEPPKPERPAEGAKKEEKKSEEPTAAVAPPQEIVLKVYMHCEGCARKVRRCLKGFDGVEEVITDCKAGKVVVKGEKADPIKVLARVQRKSHRQVELLSPVPAPDEPKKVEEIEKKVEIPVITVLLGVYMHCEACAQGLKKRILRLEGVESVEPNLRSSQVTVKGALEAEKLADYVHKRMGKQATIIKVEPEKKEEEKPKLEEQKKPEESEKEAKKNEEGGKDKKEGGDGGTDLSPPPPPPPPIKVEAEDMAVEESKIEVKKNEHQYYYYYQQQQQQVYPQRFVQEYQHEYPSPQMFSDENPNACSVM